MNGRMLGFATGLSIPVLVSPRSDISVIIEKAEFIVNIGIDPITPEGILSFVLSPLPASTLLYLQYCFWFFLLLLLLNVELILISISENHAVTTLRNLYSTWMLASLALYLMLLLLSLPFYFCPCFLCSFFFWFSSSFFILSLFSFRFWIM